MKSPAVLAPSSLWCKVANPRVMANVPEHSPNKEVSWPAGCADRPFSHNPAHRGKQLRKDQLLDAIRIVMSRSAGRKTTFDSYDYHLKNQSAEPQDADPISITLTFRTKDGEVPPDEFTQTLGEAADCVRGYWSDTKNQNALAGGISNQNIESTAQRDLSGTTSTLSVLQMTSFPHFKASRRANQVGKRKRNGAIALWQ